jgi:hypothetical protein
VVAITDEAVLAWLDAGDPERDEHVAGRLAPMLDAVLGPLVTQVDP